MKEVYLVYAIIDQGVEYEPDSKYLCGIFSDIQIVEESIGTSTKEYSKMLRQYVR